MFSLIITIVSIALVVALVTATMYAGGDTLTQGRARADASAAISSAQQIATAFSTFNANTGSQAGSLTDLKSQGYLATIPTAANGNAFTFDAPTRTIIVNVGSQDVCVEINKIAVLPESAAFKCIESGGSYLMSHTM